MSKKPKKISKAALAKFLKQHAHWKLDKKETALSITVTFHKHVEALVFIARVTVHTEVLAHYPEIRFTKAKVELSTTTSELGGISELDLALITRIDRLLHETYGEHSV